MKTTIELSDPLFEAARQAARQRGTTLRALVEMGLRQVLEQPSRGPRAFRLRKASVADKGLQEAAGAMDWHALRDLSYGDRRR